MKQKKREEKVNIKELQKNLAADKQTLTEKIAEMIQSQSMFS